MSLLCVGSCVGTPLSSVNSFPYIFTFGMQDISGYMMCKTSSCYGIEIGFPDLNRALFPNSSDILLIPRSAIFLTREHDGNTTASLQFIPSMSEEHLYLTVPNVTVLIPSLPSTCSEVVIDVYHPMTSSQLSQTRVIVAALLVNKGKVVASIVCT